MDHRPSPTRRSPTERLHREAAAACFKNANDLILDAELLLSQDRRPRAFALAVIADEEVAKCVMHVITFSGGDGLLPGFRRVSTSHRGKQIVSRFLALAAEQTAPAFDEMHRIIHLPLDRQPPRDEALSRAMAQMAQHRESGAEPKGGYSYLSDGSVQDLKNACLYVDADSDGVTEPSLQAPSADDVRDYLLGVRRRMRFLAWMFLGNKEAGRLPIGEKDQVFIRSVWDEAQRVR